MKQKEVIDKVLHVDARIEDLRSIFSEADETQRYLNLLAPDVQRVETIHRISVKKTNYAIYWIVIQPVDRVIYPMNNPALLCCSCKV